MGKESKYVVERRREEEMLQFIDDMHVNASLNLLR